MEDKLEIKKEKIKNKDLVEIINKLEAKRGIVKPIDLVDEARPQTSKLHHLFEWDDNKAGDKYRLMQARVILTTVKVEYDGEKKEEYFNVKVDNNRGYVSRDIMMSNDDMHKQVIKYAAGQLKHWQDTYADLSELKGVINEKKLNKIVKN